MEKTIITIITPIYKGEKYLPQLAKMISSNQKTLEASGLNASIEYILMNDYPEVTFDAPAIDGVDVRVINNKVNCGIHKTRVNGLKEAKGDYIVFLDQDDIISSDLVVSHLKNIGDADMDVANGIMDYSKMKLVLIRNKFYIKNLKRDYYYLYDHCPIVSPGQCMIKKDSIPQEWKENILKANCSDDYLLYLLMFQKGCKFQINPYSFVYHHVDVGTNASANSDNNYASDLEVIEILKKTGAKVDFDRLYGVAITNKYFRERKKWKYFKYLVRHPKTCLPKMWYMLRVAFVNSKINKAYKQSELKGN